MLYRVYLAMSSCKSNYHTITNTTTLDDNWWYSDKRDRGLECMSDKNGRDKPKTIELVFAGFPHHSIKEYDISEHYTTVLI